MNSKNISVSELGALIQQRLSHTWNMFLYAPARLWKLALLALALLLIAVLAADALLFWTLTISPEQDYNELTAGALTLERGLLETALALLDEREQRFAETMQQTSTSTVRNIFNPQ